MFYCIASCYFNMPGLLIKIEYYTAHGIDIYLSISLTNRHIIYYNKFNLRVTWPY